MNLTLIGKIITPIITKKTNFEVEDCRAVIINPKRRYIRKSHKDRRIYPFSFIGYLGTINLTYKCRNVNEAKTKLKDLLMITNIGRFWREGLGKIEWINGNIGNQLQYNNNKNYQKSKIRKGLPHDLPEFILQLIRYAILHDFVHTTNHRSKIYIELQVERIEELRKHHDPSENKLIQIFQKYDRIAASMTRKIRSPRTNRYTWEAKGKIDFERVAKEIEPLENNIWRLYQYIYESKELQHLNESLNYGHSSLRNHILLIVNLIVQDHLRGKIK